MSAIFSAPKIQSSKPVFPPASLYTIFHCVAEHRSFFHAATVLCMPSDLVARQVNRLEAMVGEPLFERQVPRLALTTYGQKLFDTLSPIIGKLGYELENHGQNQQPDTFQGIQIDIDVVGLARALRPYMSIFRDLPFDLKFRTANAGHQSSPDLKFYFGRKPLPDHSCFAIFPETLVAFAATQYSAPENGFSRQALLNESRLTLGHEDHVGDWHGFLGRNPEQPLPGLAKEPFRTFQQYRKAVLAGRGIGIGNAALLADDFSNGVFKRVCTSTVKRNRFCIAAIKQGSEKERESQQIVKVMREIFRP